MLKFKLILICCISGHQFLPTMRALPSKAQDPPWTDWPLHLCQQLQLNGKRSDLWSCEGLVHGEPNLWTALYKCTFFLFCYFYSIFGSSAIFWSSNSRIAVRHHPAIYIQKKRQPLQKNNLETANMPQLPLCQLFNGNFKMIRCTI